MGITITFEKAHLAFGKAMKKLRESRGLSQGDLFRRTGIERQTLSRLENGYVDDPRITTVIMIANGLGVTVDEFIKEMVRQAEAEDTK